jgi:hypothetical protein
MNAVAVMTATAERAAIRRLEERSKGATACCSTIAIVTAILEDD